MYNCYLHITCMIYIQFSWIKIFVCCDFNLNLRFSLFASLSFLYVCTSKFLFLASSMDIKFLHYFEISIFSIFWVDNSIELLFLASKILLLPLNTSFKTSSQRWRFSFFLNCVVSTLEFSFNLTYLVSFWKVLLFLYVCNV